MESDRKMAKGHNVVHQGSQIYSQSAKNSNSIGILQHQEKHLSVGQLIKSCVYAGLDGIVNSLVLLLTSYAAKNTPYQVLTFCVAAVVGDGFAMGLGDYLSAKAQCQYIKMQQRRQHYEVQHFLQDEKKQIVDIYMESGYSYKDSFRLAQLYATNPQAFVNIMMMEQLGLVVGDDNLAAKCGIATFIAYNIFGFAPVIPYVVAVATEQKPTHPIAFVAIIGYILLFVLGWAKAKIIGIDKWKSGLQILVVGQLITLVGFTIGSYFE